MSESTQKKEEQEERTKQRVVFDAKHNKEETN